MSERSASMGMNRTGMDMAPIQGKLVAEGASQSVPSGGGDRFTQDALKAPYLQEQVNIGSVPPPGSLKGIATTAMNMLKGEKANVLIDKLGARLAFERTGTRLYEALIAKAEVAAPPQTGPTVAELRILHDEELNHFHLLQRYIRQLGADPTAMTPCADVVGVASTGLLQVVADPRTTVAQSLEALLIAELADHDGWSSLISLAEGFGQDEMANDFRQALHEEERHLAQVRAWLSADVKAEAGVA